MNVSWLSSVNKSIFKLPVVFDAFVNAFCWSSLYTLSNKQLKKVFLCKYGALQNKMSSVLTIVGRLFKWKPWALHGWGKGRETSVFSAEWQSDSKMLQNNLSAFHSAALHLQGSVTFLLPVLSLALIRVKELRVDQTSYSLYRTVQCFEFVWCGW